MLVSDAQKYYTLQYKKGLITDGMFKYIRSPNYLGEVMIYSSYGLVANVFIRYSINLQHWIPWIILIYVWVSVFATRIITKEKRMERYELNGKVNIRYPEWKEYKKRSNCIVPLKFFYQLFEKKKIE